MKYAVKRGEEILCICDLESRAKEIREAIVPSFSEWTYWIAEMSKEDVEKHFNEIGYFSSLKNKERNKIKAWEVDYDKFLKNMFEDAKKLQESINEIKRLNKEVVILKGE